jgi:signal transduction histidine kinase
MAAVIAHEVRNPLAVIFNAVGSLRRLVQSPTEAAGLLAIAWEEAERLRHLVADLLEFTRPYQPCMALADLSPIIDESVAAVHRDPSLPQTRSAALEVNVSPHAPPVEVDPTLLHRALVNLLTNAFQHVSPGGRVRLIAGTDEEGWVRISFYNDGTPIPRDIAPRVFDPFFTTRAAGTGLGLAVVRRIVEDLGGRITLDETETGVSFSVWLRGGSPATIGDAPNPPARSAASPAR